MTVLTPPEILLYSDTRNDENSTNLISNFEKSIFLHILIQIAIISYTGRPHKLNDSFNTQNNKSQQSTD